MNYDFSLIVTMYNSKGTIKSCLESILTAKWPSNFNFEVILVDDGSKDQSVSIVNNLISRYKNFRIISNKENKGISYTRNQGLANCKSNYFSFMDSDDKIKPNYFESLCEYIKKDKYDVIEFGYQKSNVELKKDQPILIGHSGELKRSDMFKYYFNTDKKDLIGSYTWNKVFRKDICDKFHIEFDNNHVFEDVAFVMEYLTHVRNIFYINEDIYIYFIRKDSTVHTFSENLILDRLWSLNMIRDLSESIEFDVSDWVDKHCLVTLFYLYKKFCISKIESDKLESSLKNEINKLKKSKYITIKQKFKIILMNAEILKKIYQYGS